MATPDLQWYFSNLNMIKNVEETVVFPTRKVFVSSPWFLIIKKCTIHNKQFEETKTFQTWSDKAIKGSVINWTLASSLEFTLTVPLIYSYSLCANCTRMIRYVSVVPTMVVRVDRSTLKSPPAVNGVCTLTWSKGTFLISYFEKCCITILIILGKLVKIHLTKPVLLLM